MFSKWIRDLKIYRNHKKRVRSVVIRSNEEVIRALDTVNNAYLEAERKEIKDEMVRFGAMKEILGWLTDETK